VAVRTVAGGRVSRDRAVACPPDSPPLVQNLRLPSFAVGLPSSQPPNVYCRPSYRLPNYRRIAYVADESSTFSPVPGASAPCMRRGLCYRRRLPCLRLHGSARLHATRFSSVYCLCNVWQALRCSVVSAAGAWALVFAMHGCGPHAPPAAGSQLNNKASCQGREMKG